MDGYTCVHEYGIPNFYFHLTMTYALLRKAGVELGKGITWAPSTCNKLIPSSGLCPG